MPTIGRLESWPGNSTAVAYKLYLFGQTEYMKTSHRILWSSIGLLAAGATYFFLARAKSASQEELSNHSDQHLHGQSKLREVMHKSKEAVA